MSETTSDIVKAKTSHRRKTSQDQSSMSFQKRFLCAFEGLLIPGLIAHLHCANTRHCSQCFACVKLYQPYEVNITTVPIKVRKKLRHISDLTKVTQLVNQNWVWTQAVWLQLAFSVTTAPAYQHGSGKSALHRNPILIRRGHRALRSFSYCLCGWRLYIHLQLLVFLSKQHESML